MFHSCSGSTNTERNLAENNESTAKEVAASVKNMSENFEKSAKKLGKASSLVSKFSIRSARNIEKASDLIGQSTLGFKEITEHLEKVALDSFKSTIENLNIQKKQLEKLIEDKKINLKDLEKQAIDESSKGIRAKKEEFRLEKLEGKVVDIENKIVYIQTKQCKKLVTEADLIKVIQDNIKENNAIHQSLNELYAKNIKLEETIKSKTSEIKFLELSLQKSKTTAKDCEVKSQSLKIETVTMKNEIIKLTQDLENINKKYKVLQEELNQSGNINKETKNSFKKLLSKKSEEMLKLEDNVNTLNKEKQELQKYTADFEIENKVLAYKNSEILKKLASKESYIKTLQVSLEASNSKVAGYEIKNKTLIEKADNAHKKLDKSNHIVEEQTEKEKSYLKKIDDLTVTIVEKESYILGLSKLTANYKKQIEDLKLQNDNALSDFMFIVC